MVAHALRRQICELRRQRRRVALLTQLLAPLLSKLGASEEREVWVWHTYVSVRWMATRRARERAYCTRM